MNALTTCMPKGVETPEQLLAHYDATRRRLMHKPRAPAAAVAALPASDPMPQWLYATLHFDEHVRVWRLAMMRRSTSRMKRYARIRAVKEAIPTEVFFGPGRQRRHSFVRQRVMYEIYIAFGASLPQIGVVFNRDHTTVLHAVRKIGQMIEDGLLPPVEPGDVWAVLTDDRNDALLAEECQ